MNKFFKIGSFVGVIVASIVGCLMLCSMRQSSQVSYNVSQEADNFNVTRRIVVMNSRTDKIVFELIGNFSVLNNSSRELEVIVETAENVYKKHLIYLNDWTTYFVEDLSGADVNSFKYEVNYLPEALFPFTVTSDD